MQIFWIWLGMPLKIIVFLKFRILVAVDYAIWLSNPISMFSYLFFIGTLKWAIDRPNCLSDQLLKRSILSPIMFHWYPGIRPSRRIFVTTQKICSWVGLGSPSRDDAIVTWPWMPALFLFCQDGRTFSWRLVPRTYVVVKWYKICELPLPIACGCRCFTLVDVALPLSYLEVQLLAISWNGTSLGRILPLRWLRHWLKIFVAYDLAWSFFNVLWLIDRLPFVHWTLDVVILYDQTKALLEWALGESFNVFWTILNFRIHLWQTFIHFYFRIFQ